MSERAFPFGGARRGRTGFLPGLTALVGVAAFATVLAAKSRSSGTAETPFVAENRAAMVRMMAGMDILPSGDADRDFATAMIAHHQGAIAMAGAELHHGRPTEAVADAREAGTSVTLFDQGLVQVLEAAVTGLEPGRTYVLALSDRADGGGVLEGLASFMTNPAGAAIVNTVGPIRQIVQREADARRRYLVIAPGSTAQIGKPVQLQTP